MKERAVGGPDWASINDMSGRDIFTCRKRMVADEEKTRPIRGLPRHAGLALIARRRLNLKPSVPRREDRREAEGQQSTYSSFSWPAFTSIFRFTRL